MTHAHVLRLDGEMTVQRAAELKPLLLAALQTPASAVELDLSGVTELDSAGVQLLFLLQRCADAQQREMRLRHASEAVQQTLSLLGLQGRFGDAGSPQPR